MLIPLLLGSITVFISMAIQVVVVVLMIRYLMRILHEKGRANSFRFDAYVICVVLLMLFTGHLVQIGIWAQLFMYLGEFNDFETAYYHSTVNFASLGYGDIVMSEKWRLLGAIEASNGVLMFGLSAGTMMPVMTNLYRRHKITNTHEETT